MSYSDELNKMENDYRTTKRKLMLHYGQIAIKRLEAISDALHPNPFDVSLLDMPDEEFDKFLDDLKKQNEEYCLKSNWIEQVTKHDVQG